MKIQGVDLSSPGTIGNILTKNLRALLMFPSAKMYVGKYFTERGEFDQVGLKD